MTDSNGNTIELISCVGGYALQFDEVEAEYCKRALIFSAYNGGAGWNSSPGDNTNCANYLQ